MKSYAGFEIIKGDTIDVKNNVSPVIVTKIMEESGTVKYVDSDGNVGVGEPGRYRAEVGVNNWRVSKSFLEGEK